MENISEELKKIICDAFEVPVSQFIRFGDVVSIKFYDLKKIAVMSYELGIKVSKHPPTSNEFEKYDGKIVNLWIEGLRPRKVAEKEFYRERAKEINEAIKLYLQQGKTVPTTWLEEFIDLQDEVMF